MHDDLGLDCEDPTQMLTAREADTKKAYRSLEKSKKLLQQRIEVYNAWGAEHAARLKDIEEQPEQDRPDGILNIQVSYVAMMGHECTPGHANKVAIDRDLAMSADFDGVFSWIRCPPTEGGSDVDDQTKREWVQMLDRQVQLRCDYLARMQKHGTT